MRRSRVCQKKTRCKEVISYLFYIAFVCVCGVSVGVSAVFLRMFLKVFLKVLLHQRLLHSSHQFAMGVGLRV